MLKRTTKDATGVALNTAADLEAFAAALKENA
jgi:[acyl-carrier-protein] S-malonyltransferase